MLAGALWAALAGAAPAHAQVGPEDTCRAGQIEAAEGLCRRIFRCERRWVDSPGDAAAADARSECRDRAESRFRKAMRGARDTAAASGSACYQTRKIGELADTLIGRMDDVAAELGGDFRPAAEAEATLRSDLLRATGRMCRKSLAAARRDALGADPALLVERRERSRTKFLDEHAKAVSRALSGLVAGLDASASELADRVEAIVDTWLLETDAFEVSGVITPAEATFVDGDVNDPDASLFPNNTFASAQELPVPSTVGGYVTLPGAGPFGPRQFSGDEFDVYSAALTEGQLVALFIGDDPFRVDLDLCLYDEAGELVDCSLDVGELEQLSAPADGTYYVVVFPFEGCDCGSTYVLSLGQPVPGPQIGALRLRDDFVPEQVVLRRQPALARSAATSAASSLTARHQLRHLAGDGDRELLCGLEPEVAPLARSAAPSLGLPRIPDAAPVSADDRMRLRTLAAVKRLRRDAEVASADVNHLHRPLLVPNDELFQFQWHYALINLPLAWDITTGSPEVIVAVIDTGVLLGHPDLQGRLTPGYDFVSDLASAGDGDGFDPDPDDPGDRAYGGSSSFHGTHVAGTVAAASNNGDGVAGVAWNARIMPVRALGRGGGTEFDLIQAVRYAAGLPNASGALPAEPADVINMSIGSSGSSQGFQNALDDARDAGVLVFAAAGNSATDRPVYPASYTGVVSVSAVDVDAVLAPYSSFGPKVDLAAPGGDTTVNRDGDPYADGVLSTVGDDSGPGISYTFSHFQGTSMATPHAAGVAALMRSVAPGLTPDRFDALLRDGRLTVDLGDSGRDEEYGWGLIDARAAVVAAVDEAGGDPPPPVSLLAVNPTALSFGLSRGSVAFQLSDAGSGDLRVVGIDLDGDLEPRLTINEVDVDPDTGLGTYRLDLDRDGLGSGTFGATLTARSDVNDVVVPVVASVGGPGLVDAGYHHVLLVDAETRDTLLEVGVGAEDGVYRYRFPNVPFGDYLLVGGSDLDNDGFICHGGESCGAWPTLDIFEPIRIDGERNDLDFSTGFTPPVVSGPTAVPMLPLARPNAKEPPSGESLEGAP